MNKKESDAIELITEKGLIKQKIGILLYKFDSILAKFIVIINKRSLNVISIFMF